MEVYFGKCSFGSCLSEKVMLQDTQYVCSNIQLQIDGPSSRIC